MAFKKEKSKTWYLLDTQVENLFICEYMPDTPGDYVKVYLYALMEAGRGGELSEGDLAKRLNLSSQDVAKAFLYFEQLGMMKRVQGDMELFSLKERLYGNKNAHRETVATEKGRKILDNGPLKEMIREIQMATGCFLSTVEATEILSWMTDYNASAEVIAGAYVYCNEKGKTNYKYVGKVVKDWVSRGFATKEDIEKYLGETDQRHYAYSRVMKALGFHRTATEEEKRIIDQWMDELNCSMDSILAACGKTAGIPNPNIRYVNAVLTNKRETGAKPVSRNSVKEYYEQLRQAATERAEAAREEVYLQLPRIKQIEDHLVECSMELSKIMITGGTDKSSRIDRVKTKAEELEREKVRLLAEANIPVDYMNVKYRCEKCKDTGVTDTGEKCSCYIQVKNEVEQLVNPTPNG